MENEGKKADESDESDDSIVSANGGGHEVGSGGDEADRSDRTDDEKKSGGKGQLEKSRMVAKRKVSPNPEYVGRRDPKKKRLVEKENESVEVEKEETSNIDADGENNGARPPVEKTKVAADGKKGSAGEDEEESDEENEYLSGNGHNEKCLLELMDIEKAVCNVPRCNFHARPSNIRCCMYDGKKNCTNHICITCLEERDRACGDHAMLENFRNFACAGCFDNLAVYADDPEFSPPKILCKEGLRFLDVFDAGPTFNVPECRISKHEGAAIVNFVGKEVRKIIRKEVKEGLKGLSIDGKTEAGVIEPEARIPEETTNYSSILDPKIEIPVLRFCTYLLNKCALPTYMPNYKDNRTKKTENSFNSNFLGLLIVNHMNGKPWVSRKMFDDEDTVIKFVGYESFIERSKPELYQRITNGKAIWYSSLNTFCVNTKHNAKVGRWNQDSSTKAGLFQKHYDILLKIGFPFVEEV